jgi:hypothetical protein
MVIDSRHNRFMSGAVAFMFITNYPGILMMIALLVVGVVFGIGLKKYAGFGDVEMVSWGIIGFGVINPFLTLMFVMWATIFMAPYLAAMKATKTEKLPGTPLFFASFVITAAIGYLIGVAV